MNSKRILIVGTGFQGICDAAHLVGVPGLKIHMVDAAPFFGGILNSVPFNDFYIDKGLHFFSGVDAKMHEFLSEISSGGIHPIMSPPASGFGGDVVENFDLPDLSSLPVETRKQILSELLNFDDSPLPHPVNLSQHLHDRYGPTAGGIFEGIFKKIHTLDANSITAREIQKTGLVRLKFDTDAEMLRLKSDPRLDDTLAARRPMETAADSISSFYPSGGKGMFGFAQDAQNWLSSRGVQIHLGKKIDTFSRSDTGWDVNISGAIQEYDQIVWSNGTVHQLAKILGISAQDEDPFLPVPVVFAVFGVNAADVNLDSYIQIFDPVDVVFRVGAGGIFGNQTKDDGSTFITCECPAATTSALWEGAQDSTDQIWRCLHKYDLVALDVEPNWVKILRVPRTLKLQMAGSENSLAELANRISAEHQSIFFRASPPGFRRDIFAASTQLRGILQL